MENDIVLSAENLITGYGKENIVLSDVSFAVKKGEMVGIIGANGAGKSTLLKSLRGLLSPLGGQVFINGRSAETYNDRELACEVAYLQQTMEVAFGYSAREIVMAGRYPRLHWWEKEKERDREIVDICMEYVGVKDLADKSIMNMSGGQRQRVLLAKILAQQTPILFLDEPATGLDIFYQEEIYRFCRELCAAGKTVLMVVHELSLAARFCSRLLMIGEGKILADGVPAVIMNEKNMSQVYKVPIKVVNNEQTGSLEFFTESMAGDNRRKQLLEAIING